MSPIFVDPNVANPPAPEVIVSPDGILTATVHAAGGGVFLEADFTGSEPAPVWVRFERDGVPVFSGDPAASPGGYGVAYDMFASFGKPLTYRAVPIGYDGTEGTPSDALALVLPWVKSGVRHNTWIKSARRPDLSMRVTTIGPPADYTRDGRVNLQPVPGARRQGGSSDVQLGWSYGLEFLTEAEPEQEQIEELLSSGTLWVQLPLDWGIRDMWAEPGTLGRLPYQPAEEGAQKWSIELTEVAQPSTADTPLIVPGRSWQWAADTHTWSSLNATFDSWLDVVTPT